MLWERGSVQVGDCPGGRLSEGREESSVNRCAALRDTVCTPRAARRLSQTTPLPLPPLPQVKHQATVCGRRCCGSWRLFKALLASRRRRTQLNGHLLVGTDRQTSNRLMRTGGGTTLVGGDQLVMVDACAVAGGVPQPGGAVVSGCIEDDGSVDPTPTLMTSKKGANMTERVPVPSSEHVAEIVGRQGKSRDGIRVALVVILS